MPRLNIEDSIYKDVRFDDLRIRCASLEEALGALVRAWSLGQKYYLNAETNRLIPLSVWKAQRINDAVIECGLAVIHGDMVRITGADEHFAWYRKQQEKGIKSGETRRKKAEERSKLVNHEPRFTAVQPVLNHGSTNVEPLSLPLSQIQKNQSCANPDQKNQGSGQPRGEPASVCGDGIDLEENARQDLATYQPDLEQIYRAFPKRMGSTAKAQGMKRLSKLIRSQDDFDAIMAGVEAYKAECLARGIVGTQFVRQFGTFFGPNGPWREYARGEVMVATKNKTPSDLIQY